MRDKEVRRIPNYIRFSSLATKQEKVSDEERKKISYEEIEGFLAFLDFLAEDEQVKELKNKIANIKNRIKEVEQARNSQIHEWACQLQVLDEEEHECEITREQHPEAYPGVRSTFEKKVAEAWEADEHIQKMESLNEELQSLQAQLALI